MIEQHAIDITDLAVLGEQFPPRLMQLGFRLMQVIDAAGHDQFHYIVPPVCDVPAGPFLMGSDRQRDPQSEVFDDELPQHEVIVLAFQIGRYPLTVAEYACAVVAGVVETPETDGAVNWQVQQKHPDHPVVCISWHQAKTYAAWLAHITRQSWRLPAEAEWEKAARGIDGRIYPWGDRWDSTRANTRDGGAGTTTPVGAYAACGDASPYGAHDMAGNVWEWTSTMKKNKRQEFNYPYRRDDGRENDAAIASIRVMRGGSWSNDQELARTACRLTYPPGRLNYLGARLVISATVAP